MYSRTNQNYDYGVGAARTSANRNSFQSTGTNAGGLIRNKNYADRAGLPAVGQA